MNVKSLKCPILVQVLMEIGIDENKARKEGEFQSGCVFCQNFSSYTSFRSLNILRVVFILRRVMVCRWATS
jgi:hypothetical protein